MNIIEKQYEVNHSERVIAFIIYFESLKLHQTPSHHDIRS